ncbi:preprotein translocase subunit SecF [Thalassoglobus neptunius]|uniref:Preprotein translocase subunit SecF n=1 Tax=Thalassoglobus neptunius TaxID=1938619 RepID=A0A5C5WN71_9PLAN|nr:MMPL family transporter [Thalassoglobus neptunius]TWT51551.1 preprotein translocase subunit SecF [Thalassoglobus neptunius]
MNGPTDHTELFRRRVQKRAWVTLALIGLLVPFVIVGAIRSIDGMRITPEKWMSPTNPQRRAFEEFRRNFEGNDVVDVSWEGCTLGDPKLLLLQNELMARNTLPDLPEVVPFERVLTGPGVLEQMTSPPLGLSTEDAIQRLTGVLVGPDQETSCALVVLTYDGNEARKKSLEHLLNVSQDVTGFSEEELIVAGPPHDGVAIDAESLQGINFYGTLSTLVAAILCIVCLRSWRISGLIIGIACLGQGLVLAAVYFSGLTLDAVLIVAPPLVFVLTVSAGVHFCNYYFAQSNLLPPIPAVEAAMREGWAPCCLAAITTAVGLSSLSVSGIAPVAAFGRISACGLLVTVTILIGVLPDALCKWPIRKKASSNLFSAKQLHWFGGVVVRHSVPITLISVVGIISLGQGLRSIRTSVDATSLFASDTKIITDYQWLEEKIGPSVPVEVVVHIEDDDALSLSQQIELISTIHSALKTVPGIDSVLSARSFLPEEVWTESKGPLVRQALIRRRLHDSRDLIEESNYFYPGENGDAWRLTGRVRATEGRSYGELQSKIEAQVEEILDAQELPPNSVRAEYTGMMPLIESVQVMIMHDLFWSLLTAFGLIGISVLLVLRQPGLALMVTVLNTFPVIVTFGAMGLLSVPIDIGSMMTAGVAMGIAVDDTIHFLCFHRMKSKELGRSREAIIESVAVCGAAMLQTTLICAASMLVFALSAFVPTRQFGLLMASILMIALLSDLITLPALLTLWNRSSDSEPHPSSSCPIGDGEEQQTVVSG